tara:strand:+ start:205 stop:570 length:366 start_codon:yes stop_codon:yes gene_type:complete
MNKTKNNSSKRSRPKKVRMKKVTRTLEQQLAHNDYKSVEKNVKKEISFTDRSGNKIKGVITGISFGRNPERMYYNVKTKDSIKCCATNKEGIKMNVPKKPTKAQLKAAVKAKKTNVKNDLS